MCSGQSRTRCFAFIIFVVIDAPVATVVPFEELVRLLSLLPDLPGGAGEPARDRPLPLPPFSAGAAFLSALTLALAFALGPGSVAGAAFGGGMVPSLRGGCVSLSFAAWGKLSTCL